MDWINNYVDATLNQMSAEKEFTDELCKRFGVKPNNIKSIKLNNSANDTKVVQKIIIDMIGINRFKSRDLKNYDSITIITPNCIEIDVGEIDL